MFSYERRRAIAAALMERKRVDVVQLAERFGVTRETIRRDLNQLQDEGLAIRTHGGAVLARTHAEENGEIVYGVRQSINVPGKRIIGKIAAQMVRDGDTIFMDASSTCAYMGEYLKGKKGVTIITNSLPLIAELSEEEDLALISTGGLVCGRSQALIGKKAEQACRQYRAQKAFFSPKGFAPELGATNSREPETLMQRCMIENAKETVFLCDHTKFNLMGYTHAAQTEEIDRMITDGPLPEGWGAQLERAGVSVILVQH